MGFIIGLIVVVIGLKVCAGLVNKAIMHSLTPEQRERQKAYDKYIKDDTK